MNGLFDLVVVGGGINGTGIARDAAGRGLRVLLCEKDDLGAGTSSRSSKLIHGGLRYLEHREFRLVREALIEREVLLRSAPHIIWPLRFVLPHSPAQRPVWLIRLGLVLYDHLGGRRMLPGSCRLDLTRDPQGAPLRPEYRTGFEYSDCWVEDARLVVLNAIDARERGAEIMPRTEVVSARREEEAWRVILREQGAPPREVLARVLVNAAGPWVEQVLHSVVGQTAPRKIRLVKGSHIVVRKFWDGDHAYLLQNDDGRVVFVLPYEGDLCLVGTTDVPFEGAPEEVAASEEEREYLLRAVGRYMRGQPGPLEVLHAFAGVRPLYDNDAAASASAVTRDYVLELDASNGAAPLLSVFGGKVTTYRKLAEVALAKLAAYLPAIGPDWTGAAKLPGGDLPGGDFEAFVVRLKLTFPFLPPRLPRHYARLYGTRADRLLAGVRRPEDLGKHFGGLLFEREADYLRRTEWARTVDDILCRRTRHVLHLTSDEQERFARWLSQGG